MAKPRKASDSNMIGSRAERFVELLLKTPTSKGFLFDVVRLPDKWPTVDLYVEVREGEYCKAFFFIQVKGTDKGIENGLLQKNISKKDLQRLAEFHAPCYIVGVDTSSMAPADLQAYIIAPTGTINTQLSAIPTKHLLADNLQELYDEVLEFWRIMDVTNRKRNFKSKYRT
jgi:hypothetical protein